MLSLSPTKGGSETVRYYSTELAPDMEEEEEENATLHPVYRFTNRAVLTEKSSERFLCMKN